MIGACTIVKGTGPAGDLLGFKKTSGEKNVGERGLKKRGVGGRRSPFIISDWLGLGRSAKGEKGGEN